MYFVTAPQKAARQVVSSLTAAKNLIESTPAINKFLATNLIGNPAFICERSQEALLSGKVQDFSQIVIKIRDAQAFAGSALYHITRAVGRWSSHSHVPGAHGDRIAIVSQPVASEIVNDTVIFEVWLSSAVIFNHRRATVNHARDAAEFQIDVDDLFTALEKLDSSYEIEVTNHLFLPKFTNGSRNVLSASTVPQLGTGVISVNRRPFSHSVDPLVTQVARILESIAPTPMTLKEIATDLGYPVGYNAYKLLSKKLRKKTQHFPAVMSNNINRAGTGLYYFEQ